MHSVAPHDAHFDSQPVWITGAAGFIGRALTRAFQRRGRGVISIDRVPLDEPGAIAEYRFEDLTDPRVRAELQQARAIVHLAAHVGVRRVVRQPEVVGAGNRELVAALLRALEPEIQPRIFAASTSEVYLPQRRPLNESDPVRTVEEGGRWAYAASKIAGERVLDAARHRGRRPVHLRFFNVVGPGQDSSQGMMLPTFIEHALRGEALPVHGDGSAVRTLAHVDDVAETIAELVLADDVPAGPLNVGGNAAPASVLEIARCVLALSQSRAGIVHVDPKLVVGPAFEDVLWREPDLTRLRSLGVPVPERTLMEIVADTLERHAGEARRRFACASRAS